MLLVKPLPNKLFFPWQLLDQVTTLPTFFKCKEKKEREDYNHIQNLVVFPPSAHLKGALEERASEHELLSQQARVESLVRKLSSLIEKAMHSLEQNDLEYFKGKNKLYQQWWRRAFII